MSIRSKVDRMERDFGPPPGPSAAVVDDDGRVVKLLAGDGWIPAPAGFRLADVRGPLKVYQGFDPETAF